LITDSQRIIDEGRRALAIEVQAISRMEERIGPDLWPPCGCWPIAREK